MNQINIKMNFQLEPKKKSDIWKWLTGIFLIILIVWLLMEATEDEKDFKDDMPPASTEKPATINSSF